MFGSGFIVWAILGLADVIGATGASPCPAEFPCSSTYPAAHTGPYLEIGMLACVDLSDELSLATRSMMEIGIDMINSRGTCVTGVWHHSRATRKQLIGISSMLPGTTLVGVWGATGRTTRGGIFGMLAASRCTIESGTNFKMSARVPIVIGPMYSIEAVPASLIAADVDVAIVGGGCTAPELGDKTQYPTFSRMIPSDNAVGLALAMIIKGFGYSYVACISRSDAWGVGLSTAFVNAAQMNGITVLAVGQFDEDQMAPDAQLGVLKQSGARIIVSFIFNINQFAQSIKRMGMTAPDFWHIGDTGWTTRICAEENKPFLAGSLVIYPTVNRSSVLYNDLKNEYKRRYNLQQTYRARFDTLPTYTLYLFEALYFGVTALSRLASAGHVLQTVPENVVTQQLRTQTMIGGVSGTVELNHLSGERIGNYDVVNMQQVEGGGMNWLPIGLFTSKSTFELNPAASIIWPSGNKNVRPLDAIALVTQHVAIAAAAITVVQFLASLGLIFGVSVLAFNVYFRNLPFVRISSPVINIVIILGCLLNYVVMFLIALENRVLTDSRLTLICTLRVVLISIAYTLWMGGLTAKTYRLFRIFSESSSKVAKIKNASKPLAITDLALISSVVAMLAIDAVIISAWFGTESMHRYEVAGTPYMANRNTQVTPVFDTCTSANVGFFVTILMTYKGFMTVLGAFLAFNTRDINIPACNDSNEIALSIYTVTLVSLIILPILWIVTNPTISMLFLGIPVWFLTTMTLTVLFVPKMYAVHNGTAASKVKATQNVMKAKATPSGPVPDLHIGIVLPASPIAQSNNNSPWREPVLEMGAF